MIRQVVPLLSISLLLGSLVSAAPGPQCRDLFISENVVWNRISREIRPQDERVHYNDDLSYLREYKRANATGSMQSKYDRRYQTRFYFSGTAVPDRNGSIQMVDPQAKAVYVFFHGSGTMKSSGRNFAGMMNTLGQMGYSAISFDHPFHMEGPRAEAFYNSDYYMKWLNQIVSEIRAQAGDKPIYMVGHSFGPDVIAEYLTRHPQAVQGAVLISPAGFDSVLSRWYDRHTSKMKFGGDVAENTLAGQWAGVVSQQFRWNKTNGAQDPTIANPSLRLRVLSGDREEYVPSPLGGNGLPSGPNTYDLGKAIRKHLRNAQVTIEPGIGHYIFDHRDAQGRNAVMREVLALDGADAGRISETVKEIANARQKPPVEQIAFNYATDRIFQAWVNTTVSRGEFLKSVERRDERFLKMVELNYTEARAAREAQIVNRILETADRDPEFYARYKKVIDGMRTPAKRGDTSLFNAFADYLESNAAKK